MAVPKILTSWDVSINGETFLGRASSVQLPKITEITEDLWGSGMYGKQKVVVGMEPMQCTIKLYEFSPFVFNVFGLSGDNTIVFLKGAMRNNLKEVTPLTAILNGRFHEIELDTFEGGKVPQQTLVMDVRRYELNIGAHPALLVDLENNIVNLKGVTDLVGDIRKALGG
jgi:P2 family phage contractile tail tube protein